MVIPSFYEVGNNPANRQDIQGFNNSFLRIGEVIRIIYPEDKGSISKKFLEYDVLVQHRENGTAVTKIYQNCMLANPLAGLADKSFFTLRTSPATGSIGSNSAINDGVGSKVLILCINAEHSSAIIISGVRDSQDNDKGIKSLGHHGYFEFNGILFKINDDGSFELVYNGKKDANGKVQTSEEYTGTTIKVNQKGDFVVSAKDQLLNISNENKTITIKAEKDLILDGQKIHIAAGADEHAVLGDKLNTFLGKLIDAIAAITVATAVGPSSVPVNVAQILALKAELMTILSTFIYVKR